MPSKTNKGSKRTRKKRENELAETASSSEDHESSNALEIITRLSQKYLNTGSKELKSKKKLTNNNEYGYEGDEDTTASSSPSSVGSPYDFEDEPMSEDSPSQSGKGKSTKKSNKKQTNQTKKKSPKIKPEQKTPAEAKQKSNIPKNKLKSPEAINKSVRFNDLSESIEKIQFPKTPIPNSSGALQNLDVNMVDESQRQLRKRKTNTTESTTPNVKIPKKETFQSAVVGKMCKNTSIQGKISPEMVQDTSTPNEMVRTKALTKKHNDSCFGFEEVKRTSLPVSPVRKMPITPLSDYASMDTFHDMSMEDSLQKPKPPSPELFSMEIEDDLSLNKSVQKVYRPRKKTNYTKKQQTTKSNQWANQIEKMAVEFEAIESFELSIEQD